MENRKVAVIPQKWDGESSKNVISIIEKFLINKYDFLKIIILKTFILGFIYFLKRFQLNIKSRTQLGLAMI